MAKTKISVGDYVIASRWSDCSPSDPWSIGFVLEIVKSRYYRIGNQDGILIPEVGSRLFPHATKITPELGHRLCQEMPQLEDYPVPEEGWKTYLGITDLDQKPLAEPGTP